MKAQKSIRIYGVVQGVWFRKYTRDKARELNLTGWVCNEPDGSVRIVAFGDPDRLEDLVRWCHQGSPLSRVDSVLVEDMEPEDWTSFDIRR